MKKYLLFLSIFLISHLASAQWNMCQIMISQTPVPAQDSLFGIKAHSAADAMHGVGRLYPITSTSGFSNPMTTSGDLIYGGASGVATRLANGTANKFLRSNGTTLAPTWETPPTPGIDDVFAVGQALTAQTNVSLASESLAICGDDFGTGIKLDNENGITSIGDACGVFNGNTLKVNDASSTAYFDNAGHDGFFGINTSSRSDNESFKVNGHAYVTGNLIVDGTINGGGDEGKVLTSTGSETAPQWLYGIKRYAAFVSQSDTNDPTATVLYNTLGGTVVWTYSSTGNYTANLVGAFTDGKTASPQDGFACFGGAGNYTIQVVRNSTDQMNILISDDIGNPSNSKMLSKYIEFIVYP